MATTKENPVVTMSNNAVFNQALREFKESRLLTSCINFDAVLQDIYAVELESCSSCVKKVKLLHKISTLNEEDGEEIAGLITDFLLETRCVKLQPQALINLDLGLDKALGNFTATFTSAMKDCFSSITNSTSEIKNNMLTLWEKIKPFMSVGFGLIAFLIVFATIKVAVVVVKDFINIVKFLSKMVLPTEAYEFVFAGELHDIEEQSSLNWHGYILRLIVTVLSGFTMSVVYKFFHNNSLARFMTGDLISLLPTFIEDVMAYFKLPFTFNTQIPNAVVSVINRLVNCDKILRRHNINQSFKTEDVLEFFSVVKDYEYCRDKFMTNKKVSDFLHNFIGDYKTISDFTLSLKQSEDRMEPIVVYIVGEPGCGKSSMYSTLVQIISGVCYDTTAHQATRWTYTEGLKHFDGYKNQEIVVVDDAFQTKDSETCPNTLVADLIRMVNTSSYNLPMAHLDNKGTTYFTSDFILATSNTRSLGANRIKSINTIDALIRRLSFPFEIKLKRKLPKGLTVFAYIAQEEGQWDANDPEYTNKCLDLRDSLWSFRRLDLKSGQAEGEDFTFREFVEQILCEFKRKKYNVLLSKKNAIKDFSPWKHLKEQSGILSMSGANRFTQKTKAFFTKISTPDQLTKLRSLISKYVDDEQYVDEILEHYYNIHLLSGIKFAYCLPDMLDDPHGFYADYVKTKREVFYRTVETYDFSFIKLPNSSKVTTVELGSTIMRLIYDDLSILDFSEQSEMRDCFYERKDSIFVNILRKHLKPIILSLSVLIGGITLYKMIKTVGKHKRPEKKQIEPNKVLADEMRENMVKINCQGSNMSCESLISFMTSKLKKNTVRFCVVTNEKDGEYEQYLGYAILPKTNTMVFPYHFLKLANKSEAIKIRCYYISINPLEEDRRAFEISKAEYTTWKQYHRKYENQLLPTDLVIVNVITAGVKDITEQLFPSVELSKGFNSLSTAASMHLVVKPIGQHYGIQFKTVGNFNSYVDSFAYGNPNVKYSHLVMYNMPTSYGDCGGCVVVNTKSDGFKIIGCHTAGDSTSRAMCAILTQEDIRNFGDVYRNYTVPITVAQQAGVIKKQNNFLNAKSSISRYPGDIVPKIDYVIQKFPSVLSPWVDKEGNKRSPMKEAQLRYQDCPMNYSLDVVGSVFFKDVACKLVPLNSVNKIYDRVWTFEEAVVGANGISFFDSLNRATSSGAKYSKISPNGKYGFFGDGETFNLDNNNCAILKKDVENIITNAQRGIRLEHIFKDCLKDELLSKAKVDIGKTRLFNTGPLDYQIAYKMYCGAFSKVIQDNMFRIGISIGINPYKDWDLLFKKLTSRFDNAFAGDFTGWDMKLTPQFFIGVLEMMNKWYDNHGGTETDNIVRRVLFAEVYNSLHQGLDGIYYWFTGNSSGHASTAINNSVYNLLLFAYCAREITGESIYDIADFAIYGDDNLFVTNHMDFNLNNCSKHLERFGMYYGTDTKDGTTYAFKSIYECSFLKRKFVNSDNDILAPLDIHSVLTCLFYKKTRDETDNERLLKYFRQCCELSLHTPDIFHKYFEPIWIIVKEFSWVKLKHPTLYLTRDKQSYLRDLTRGFEYY